VSNFFKNYLVGRKTSYCWNNFISPSFDINVGIGQGFALSPILSALYLSPVFHFLEKYLKILKIPISMIYFVDNGLFISQLGLIVKHGKTDVFHFSRLYGAFDPPLLDLSPIGGPSILPKETWKYLGFIFN